MKILFLSRWYPFPANNGSKIRILNLLKGLSKLHQVKLLSFAEQAKVDTEPAKNATGCDEIRTVEWKPFAPESLRARLGLLSMTPRSIIDTYSPQMAGLIRQMMALHQFNLVIASQWQMASYERWFRGPRSLFEEIETGVVYEQYQRAMSTLSRLRSGLTWFKFRRYLFRLLEHFDASTVVSDQERELLARIAPGYGPAEVIPNCINLEEYLNFHCFPREPHTLIFTGSFRYSANYDAMKWFLGEVYPLIKMQLPEARLTITGDHAGLPLPPVDDIIMTGHVEDINAMIAGTQVSIVPMRVGGGTRLKILEAMALRTPVVATSKGAEGLDVQDSVHLLIADTPDAFARAVARLACESQLREQLADNAFKLIREKYDWSAVMPRFLDVIERVVNE